MSERSVSPATDTVVTLLALLAGLATATITALAVVLDGWDPPVRTGWAAVRHRAGLDCADLSLLLFLALLLVSATGPPRRLSRALGAYRSTAAGIVVTAQLATFVLMCVLLKR